MSSERFVERIKIKLKRRSHLISLINIRAELNYAKATNCNTSHEPLPQYDGFAVVLYHCNTSHEPLPQYDCLAVMLYHIYISDKRIYLNKMMAKYLAKSNLMRIARLSLLRCYFT